jgi:hypothetical protein
MIVSVLGVDREHMWDLGGVGGLLKGQLFHDLVTKTLPVQTFSECKIPLSVTAYDLLRFKTNCITEGSLATAMVASCCFPGLFQPVMINYSPHIDGGVWDGVGLMGLPFAVKNRNPRHKHHHHHNHHHQAAVTAAGMTVQDVNCRDSITNKPNRKQLRWDSSVDAACNNNNNNSNNSDVVTERTTATVETAAAAVETAAASLLESEPTSTPMAEYPSLVVNIVFGSSSVAQSVLPLDAVLRGAKVRQTV